MLTDPRPKEQALEHEIIRLNKVVQALMDRAERSTSVRASDFNMFQTAIVLEEQVRRRTAELEALLRENEKISRDLRESEAKFRALVSQPLVGINIVEDGKYTYSNARFDEMLGYTADEIRRLGPVDIVPECDRPAVMEYVRDMSSGALERIDHVFLTSRKNGNQIDTEVHGISVQIGGKRALIQVVLDVTERIRAEREVHALQERLRELSTHDALTGLHNRRSLEDILGQELILAERQGRPVSIIMCDLDHFKAVNDRYGHLGGDEVLRVFGSLLKQRTRGSDISCRYGGEEFLVVLPAMAKVKAAERAEQLRSAVAARPFAFGGSPIAVSASFGVATFPSDGLTCDELIAAADEALYAAKAAGRNRVNVSSEPTVGAPG